MKNWKIVVTAVVVAVAGVFLLFGFGSKGKESAYVTAAVEKGHFEVLVPAKGKLEAAASVRLSSPISWKPIIWLIPEGSIVRKGDVVVKFDKQEIEDAVRESKGAVRTAQARLSEAQHTLDFERRKSVAKTETCKAALAIAEVTLADLRARPRPDDLRRAEVDLRQATTVMEAAREEYEILKKMVEKDGQNAVIDRSTLRRTEADYRNAQADCESARVRFAATQAGTAPESIREAELRVEQARLDLDQSQSELSDRIGQMEADIKKSQAEAEKARNKLDIDQEEMANSDLPSPADGMVAYLTIENKKLAKGMTTWRGASIMDLPDISRMLLKARIRETDIGLVKEGQSAVVRVDAIPEREFAGKVKEVGRIAVDSSESEVIGFAQNAEDTGVRVFDLTIEVATTHTLMKPNMVGKAEILVASSEDAIHIPADAVFEKDGKPMAFVANGHSVEARPVEVGRRSLNRVEVRKGLSPGERVCLRKNEN